MSEFDNLPLSYEEETGMYTAGPSMAGKAKTSLIMAIVGGAANVLGGFIATIIQAIDFSAFTPIEVVGILCAAFTPIAVVGILCGLVGLGLCIPSLIMSSACLRSSDTSSHGVARAAKIVGIIALIVSALNVVVMIILVTLLAAIMW